MPERNAIARLLDRPEGVALAFAPFAVAIWALQTDFIGAGTEARRIGLSIVQLATLAGGLGLYWLVRRGETAPPHGARRGRVWLAAVAAVVAVTAHILAADARLNEALAPGVAFAVFVNMALVVGLGEEAWFRGLWMRAAQPSAALAVGVGALAFGLLHWPFGLGRVATTAALGALYGAARWRGAPLWALALAHGAVNTVASTAIPASAWRFDPMLAQALFCALALAAAAAILTLTDNDTRATRR